MSTKKTFKNNAEVVGKAYEFDALSAPTTDKKAPLRFSRADRVCVVVSAEGKVLKESNYLDCLFYCATNTEKALRVEFLQAKIPSFYDRLRDSEELAKQLLSGNAVYINKTAKTMSEALVAENNVLEKISIPNDVLSGPVDLNSVEKVAGHIEQKNPNCILIILDGENPEDEINAKMDQVSSTIPNNQIRPLLQTNQTPELPMLEDYGYPEEDNEKKDEKGTEYTNNHQGEEATTRDMKEEADEEQVIAPTKEVEDIASSDNRETTKETADNVEEQYCEPKTNSANPMNVDANAVISHAADIVPAALTGFNAGWLGRGIA